MRMPILSYFVFVGAAHFAVLILASSQVESNISAIQVSQMVGLPAPFKAPPDDLQSKIGD